MSKRKKIGNMTVLKGTLTIKRELPEAQVDIQASNRTFRERFGVLTPGSIRLMAVTVNIDEPTYQWSYFDDELEAWVDFSGVLSKLKDWTVVPGDWNARWFRVTVKSATLKDPISARIMIDKVEEDIEPLISKARHIGGEVILSQASMKCIDVVDVIDGYLCYIERGKEGEIVNEFVVGDQAYCRVSSGSKTKYYWRLVTEVAEGYIKLSMTEKDGNDIPAAGDNIIQLGNRIDPLRQTAIVISSVSADAPSYVQYAGIDGYSLVGKSTTKFTADGNEVVGKMTVKPGSSGWENLDGLTDTFDSLVSGSVNLLRNTGFSGDFDSTELDTAIDIHDSTSLYSDQLKFWQTESVTIQANTQSRSGYEAFLSDGSMQQSFACIPGERYVLSLKLRGVSAAISVSDVLDVYDALSQTSETFVYKFTATGSVHTFNLSGSCYVFEIKIERGTVSSDWMPSVLDNDKSYSLFNSIRHITDAIKNGETSILGGLILSKMIQLGNYSSGTLSQVTAGMSGVVSDGDEPFLWGGGTFEQAITALLDPTAPDGASIAMGHNGLAVLNNIHLRGTIHAGSKGLKNLSEWAGVQNEIDLGKEAKDYVDTVLPGILGDIQNQVDGVVDSYFFAYVPTAENYPASEWTTPEMKQNHAGDTFTNIQEYVDDETTPNAGKSWRWTGSAWTRISDSDAVRALEIASQAFDVADGKRTIFVVQPTSEHEYKVGDMWTNATFDNGEVAYNNDLLRCVAAKDKGLAFSITHWVLATKYTDDAVAQAAKDLAQQAQNAADYAQDTAEYARDKALLAADDAIIALQAIDDIASDNVLDAGEKPAQRQAWEVALVERDAITLQGEEYGISVNGINESFIALSTYLNAGVSWSGHSESYAYPAWISDANLGLDTVINGATLRLKWKAYYDTKTALLNGIYAKAKLLADQAQASANEYYINTGGRNLMGSSPVTGMLDTETGSSILLNYAEGVTTRSHRIVSGGATGIFRFRITYQYPITTAGWYTVSFKYKHVDGLALQLAVKVNMQQAGSTIERSTPDDTWHSWSGSVYVNQYLGQFGIVDFEQMGGNWFNVLISDLKVEKGKIATAWSMAPEDVNTKLTALDYLKEAIGEDEIMDMGLALARVLLLKNSSDEITGGMSGLDGDNVAMWAGGSYQDALDSQDTPSKVAAIDRKDGSGHRAFGKFMWDVFGGAIFGGLLRTAASGARVEIDPDTNALNVYDENENVKASVSPKSVMKRAGIASAVTQSVTYSPVLAEALINNGGSKTTQVLSNEVLQLDASKTYSLTIPVIEWELDFFGSNASAVYVFSVVLYNVDTGNTITVYNKQVAKSFTSAPFYDQSGELAQYNLSELKGVPGGSYKLQFTVTVNLSPVRELNMASARLILASGKIMSATSAVETIEIGRDGINIINSLINYFHFSTDGFLLKHGDYSLDADSNGILVAGHREKVTKLSNTSTLIYQCTSTDSHIVCRNTGALTLILPETRVGHIIHVWKIATASVVINVNSDDYQILRAGSLTSNVTLTDTGKRCSLLCDGTNWLFTHYNQ